MVDNVHSLVDTLPKITCIDENIRLTFDHGYRTMKFIEDTSGKNYKISTIVTTAGSRHEMDNFVQTCLDCGEGTGEVMRNVALFQKWVGDFEKLTGSRIRIAKKSSTTVTMCMLMH